MKNISYISFFKATILAILTFFSVSFITILFQINPIHYYRNGESYRLAIGFPFVYYEQFWLRGNDFPNSSWNAIALFVDIILTWSITVLCYNSKYFFTRLYTLGKDFAN